MLQADPQAILAQETMGLSSYVINWPDMEESEQFMQDLLDLVPDERPVLLTAAGFTYSDGLVAYFQNEDLESLRSYNQL